MRFQHPFLLVALLPLVFAWWMHGRRSKSSVEVGRYPLLIGSVVSLVVALANPYWSTVSEQRLVKGVDLIVMIDISQSMFCPAAGNGRRIDQARNFVRSFLPQVSGSSVAVIYFAGDAQIGCPLTPDLQAVNLFLDSITPAMSARPGTQLQALETVLEQVVGATHASAPPASRKLLGLLFSDGEFFDSTRNFHDWLAGHRDFEVFTFLCGKGKSPVPKYDLSGPYPGALSEVHPETLQALAASSSAFFYDLSQTASESIAKNVLQNVKEIIAKGEPMPQYRFLPFAILSLICLLGYQLFPIFSRSIPRPNVSAALAVICFLIVSLSMKSSENQTNLFRSALEDTQQKQYDAALKKLQQLQKEGASEEVEIAIGNIYFQQSQWDAAIQFYKKVVERNVSNNLARWNWEVALKRKSHPPPEKKEAPQTPRELPDETKALLKYFDQLEKEQMQLTNSINANTNSFAW